MPTYEYECERCKRTFDVEQRMSDDPIKTCQLPTARTLEERFESFHNSENSGGAASWNGRPFFLHPDRCKCQDKKVEERSDLLGYPSDHKFDRDPYPHRHRREPEEHPCARCTECSKYDPVDAECGGSVRRLIAGSTGFVLKGTGWFKDGY